MSERDESSISEETSRQSKASYTACLYSVNVHYKAASSIKRPTSCVVRDPSCASSSEQNQAIVAP